MRLNAVFFLFLFSAALHGQPSGNTILQSRPDVFVEVRKSQVGPDYVRVQAVDADYPAELLEKQCKAIGTYMGGEIRGLDLQQVPTGASPGGKPGAIVTAEFAVNGLIRREEGVLELNAICKAFAGADAPHTVDLLAIIFRGETPKEGTTLKAWAGPSAEVFANFDPTVPMVEYRVALKTQVADEIRIPATIHEQIRQEKSSKESSQTTLLPWVIGAGVLIGLLVYFALRPRVTARRTGG